MGQVNHRDESVHWEGNNV